MKKSSSVKIGVFFILVFFISQFVFAVPVFDAFVDSPLDVFQCETSSHSLEIVNDGVESFDVSFSVSGKAADWFFLPESVSVAPGSAKDVPFNVAVPCDAKLGGYPLKVLIFSDSVEKFLELFVDVQKPVNLDVVPNVFLQKVAPCSPAFFNVSVINKASFEDSFSFSIDQFSGADIVPRNAVLAGGQKQDVVVSFTPDDCSLFGEFPVVFTAVAEKTDVRADLDLALLIDPVDVLTVGEGVDRIVTNHSLSSVKIPVRNNGVESVSYLLSVDGPDWVKLSVDSINVAGGSDASFVLLMGANESVVNAPYHVVISANSSVSGRVYSKDVIVKVVGSAFFERFFQSFGFGWFWSVLGLVLAFKFYLLGIVVLCVLVGVFIVLRRRRSVFFACKSNAGSGKVDKKIVKKVVESAGSSDADDVGVDVRRRVERDLRAEFKLVPKSAIVSLSFWSQNFARILVGIVLVLIACAVYFVRDLFLVYLDFFVLGVIVLLVLFIFKKVSGKFFVSKHFGFLITDDGGELFTGWRKGLLRVAFKMNDSVDGLRVFVKSGFGGVLPPVGELFGAFRVGANCSAVLFRDVCLTFAVKKSFISGLNASEKDLRVLSFVDGRWRNIDFSVCGSDSKFLFIEVFAESVGVFAVVCRNKSAVIVKPVVGQAVEKSVSSVVKDSIVASEVVVGKKSVKSGKIDGKKKSSAAGVSEKESVSGGFKWVAYVVLFVLIGLVVGAVVYLVDLKPQESPMPVRGIQPQVWLQDSVHSFDLSKYFSDPDGDVLSFSARPVENIGIAFNGSIAVFTPDSGWSGVRSTVFSVADSDGAIASSNEVSLVVNKLVVPASIEKFLPQIIGGGLFVIVVVILLVFREQIIKFLDDDE